MYLELTYKQRVVQKLARDFTNKVIYSFSGRA